MLDFLHAFLDAAGHPPTYTDILDGTGVTNQSMLLHSLQRRRLIAYEKNAHTRGLVLAVTSVNHPERGLVEVEQLVKDPATGELHTAAEWQSFVQRRCLCCNGPFTSKGKFNRLCPTCNKSASEESYGSNEYGTGYVSNGNAISWGKMGGQFLDGRK